MSVRIYSPAAGIPVLLKVEDKNNGAQACETLGTTTVANAWETIVFDFANEQPGTPALNLAWTYNKVAIFFDFGNMGAGDIFYWDDVQFLNYSIDIQTVSIVSGWSIISTYIDPFEASLDSVFAPVLTEVVIVKDWNGLVFWPQFGLNAIGSLTIGGGYQAKFVTAQNLDVTGTALVPENTPVSIPAGWSIIGYLRNTPGNAEVMFSTIVSDLTIAKNGSGLVYWPFFGLNAIGNLIPGEGYQLKLVNGVTLYYPANGPVSLAKQSNITCNYYTHSINTGDNMTVAFPIASWNVIPNMGDEIGAFNADGSLIGSAVFTNNHTVLTIWGNSIHHLDDDGAESGEQVHFRLYSSDNNRETEIEIDRWESGDDIYKTNEIAIAGNASYMEDLMTAIAYPNPAKETLTVQLTSANANVIDLKIFNAVGVLIENQRTENKPGDDVLIQINTSEYTSGSYYFTVNAGTSVYMDRFQVIK